VPGEYAEVSDRARLSAVPVVSVIMVTYNHERWIGEAIESVVSQECPFDYELIIGEDCSSDQTRTIVLDYQRRFPHLIRVIHSESNVGAAANHGRSLQVARGEFLAFCEGDDYWCHLGKLAAQVALLRAEPAAAMAHTDWIRARFHDRAGWKTDRQNSNHRRMRRKYLEGDLFTVFYFAKILRTCTLLVRRSAIQAFLDDNLSIPAYRFGDTVIAAYLTSRWRVAYWPEVSAVYRESPGSLLRSGLQSRITFLQSSLQFDSDARRYFAGRRDYPGAYRWEVSVGLLLWAIKARDPGMAMFALRDIRANFGVLDFIAAGWQTVRIRLPSVFRQRGVIAAVASVPRP
jgi:glycosyltransferase involved in cell wall biosynthesis